jgi:hypothetical protein
LNLDCGDFAAAVASSRAARTLITRRPGGKFCRVLNRFRRMNPRLESARRPFDLHTIFKTAISGKRRA